MGKAMRYYIYVYNPNIDTTWNWTVKSYKANPSGFIDINEAYRVKMHLEIVEAPCQYRVIEQ